MLLQVLDLRVSIGSVTPLDGVSFALDRGQIHGLVGESGSGKSLTAMAIMGLLPLIGGRITGGNLAFDGHSLQRPEAELRKLRGRRIAFITQNPMTALDPVRHIGGQVDEVAMMHLGLDRKAARDRTIQILTQLRISSAETVVQSYPHQLSGGMKQRIVIAMALAGEPDLIVADEPTTALDVTVQAQIIHILTSLVRERGLGLLLITHDMGVVAQACDLVTVLYAGRVAEKSSTAALFEAPRHPYTTALMASVPRDDMPRGVLKGIPGSVPSVAGYPAGCRFHPRCPRKTEICERVVPPLVVTDKQSALACHNPLEGTRP
jgi:oligopeptide/dipeptide ABC transporter ATP-binding protein